MKMLKYYLLLTILSSKMFCDINSSELAMTPESLPRLPEKDMTSGSQIVIDRGKGIILIGRSNALVPNEELKGFEGYEVIDLDIPGKKEVLKMI